MREKWINDIKDRMDNFTPDAPENLMDDIQKEMSRRGLQPLPVQKHKRISMWYPAVSAAAAMLALYLGWNLLENDEEGRMQIAQEVKQAVQMMDSIQTAVHEEQLVEPLLAMNVEGEADTQQQKVEEPTVLVSHALPSEADSTEEVQEQTPSNVVPVSNDTDAQSKPSEKFSINEKTRKKQTTFEYTPRYRSQKRGVSAGAYYAGAMVNHNQSGRGLMLAAANPYGSYRNELSGKEVDGLLSQTDDHEMHIRHNQPVKIGVSVDVPLASRWSIQTGVTYSFLSSEISQEQTHLSQVSKQNLHYIGIPVRANYQWWEHKSWKVYSAVGGEVERMVSGQLKTRQLVSEKTRSTSTRNLKDSKLQFSGNVMVGVEYQWSKRMGVYAETGAVYYFDNGSNLKTIYSEKPFNVSLALGFRFHTK